jgi:hypothetical protein
MPPQKAGLAIRDIAELAAIGSLGPTRWVVEYAESNAGIATRVRAANQRDRHKEFGKIDATRRAFANDG